MANGNDYLIPFGIDSRPYFQGLKDIAAGNDRLATETVESNSQMQKAFNTSAQSVDRMNKSIDESVKKSQGLTNEAKALGSELGKSLNGKNIGPEFEKKLQEFTDKLAKFQAQTGKKLNFNIDTAKLEEFERMLTEGADALKVLGSVIDFSKQKLAELDPQSEEFAILADQVAIAESFLKALNDTSDNVANTNISLSLQLRETTQAMLELAAAGKENTKQYADLAKKAGELKDKIGDVKAQVKALASDTKSLDAGISAVTGLAAAFTVAQGAASLFGDKNEEIAQAIQKTTAALAVLNGLQAIANVLNKDGVLFTFLYSNAQKSKAAATIAAAAATTAEAAATGAATVATRTWTAVLLANPIFLLVGVIAAVTTALLAFSGGQSDAAKATEDLNKALERQTNLLKLDENDLDRRTDLAVALAKAAGKSETDILNIEGRSLQQRLELKRTNLIELQALYNDEFNMKNRSVEDEKKLSDLIIDTEEDIADTINEIKIKGINRDIQQKKDTEDRNKKALEESKKLAEEQKKILEQQIKFTRELEAARVEAIKDEYDKERAEVRKRFSDKIEDLQREVVLSAEASIKRTQLITRLRENEAAELDKITKKELTDRAVLEFNAQRLRADLLAEGAQKEIEQIRLDFIEKRKRVEEEYKNDAETRKKLIALLNQAEGDAQEKATNARILKSLELEEENQILQIETAAKFIGASAKVEEQKQIAILRVQLEYAEKKLEELLAAGNAENSTVVLQAKKLIQQLTKALGDAVEESKGNFDLFELLGLGDLSSEQKAAVEDAVKSSLESITQITDFIIDQYQRQIDKRQEMIDQIEDSITDLEGQLDKEKELRENGFANNVELIEKEIEEKKKQRDEEVKQQEELQRKQRAAQKAQLIIDTITQANNLITASTEIFKSLAGIPFVGIPLAIATIALMTGAFVTAKVKAFQLVNSGQQYGEGGYIDGKPHGQGGKKYIAADGSGEVKELERGEFVTKEKATRKYSNLLEAINDDRLDKMSENNLREMLAGMGISFDPKTGNDALQGARARDEAKQTFIMMQPQTSSAELSSIDKNVQYLADRKRADSVFSEDDKFYYERKGNTLYRIPKK